MIKLIISDVDDVLLRWQDTFCKWVLNIDLYRNKDRNELKNHNTIEKWLGCSTEEVMFLISSFNNSHYFENIPPCEDAQIYVNKLKTLGYKFIAISSCGEDRDIQKKRWNNLSKYFPNTFISLHCVGLGESKYDYLSLYRQSIWVEDNLNNACDGAMLGHRTFLIDQLYNKTQDNKAICRVKNWGDIYNIIYSQDSVSEHLCCV